jgi:hypothetical protein
MLRFVLFDLELFDSDTDAGRENSRKRTLALLEALTLCNQFYLSAHPETPLIYQSGIKYKVPAQYKSDEDIDEVGTVRKWLEQNNAPRSVMKAVAQLEKMTGGERFREIPRILENGGGDCDNVSSWRCAELRQLGIPAKPYITWRQRPDGGTTYHVTILFSDGTHEDPSLLLGMGGADRAADRAEEERKLGERTGAFLSGDNSIFGNFDDLTAVTSWAGTGALPQRRRPTVFAGISAVTPFSAQGSTPSDFGQGLQYTIPFQTDDSYESWSPTRPQAYYANPQYKSGLITQSGPIFNTLLDDDFDDRFDGEVTPADRRRWERELRRVLR